MIGNLLTGFGIVVSLVVFVVEWRRTIGARRERVSAVNAELKRMLVRRVVVEDYTPTLPDLSKLIQGKATDSKVLAGDLLSEGQILNVLYAQVFENDLIPVEKKNDILRKVENAYVSEERSKVDEKVDLAMARGPQLLDFRPRQQAYIGILASITGTIITGVLSYLALPYLKQAAFRPTEILPRLLATIGVSLAVIALFALLRGLRDSMEQNYSKGGEVSSYLQFENRVLRAIKKSEAVLQTKETFGEGLFDFLVDFKGRRIGIEAKNWVDPLPRGAVENTLRRLRAAMDRSNVDEAILVTRGYVPPRSISVTEGVRIMNLPDLETYLR